MTETEKMRKVFHRDFLGAHRYTTRGGTVRPADSGCLPRAAKRGSYTSPPVCKAQLP